MKYKDHPALLTWFIGNELNFDFTNPKVYDAVNQTAKMIKSVDPHHPTTTTLAGFDKKAMDAITKRASALDFISFQLYADVVNLPKYIESYGYTGPYMITEWGAVGHWEVRKESTATQVGGDKEQVPEIVDGLIKDPFAQKIEFEAPKTPGAYRLYAYVYDGNGNAAHANIPFFVKWIV